MIKITIISVLTLVFSSAVLSQVPLITAIQIAKAEDARRYDATLENLMKAPNEAIRSRAALAAGRIGDDKALPVLTAILEKDQSEALRTLAAFAIGEIESVTAAGVILATLKDTKTTGAVRSRAVEAAGKIAAANSKDDAAKTLGAAILDVLVTEDQRRSSPDAQVIRLALTAALRARPAAADEILRKFLAYSDPEIVADALNALARLRAKNANRVARDLLATNLHALVRANAARLLGVAEDKDAFDVLLKAATDDSDSRVRVSAIRSLALLKDARAADKLLERAKRLMGNYENQKTANRWQKNEMLEIAAALGRLLANSRNELALKFFRELYLFGQYHDPEVTIAWARVDAKDFVERGGMTVVLDHRAMIFDWRFVSSQVQGLAELANSTDGGIRKSAEERVNGLIKFNETQGAGGLFDRRAVSDEMRALAAFKPSGLDATLRAYLQQDDIGTRAAAANLLAGLPASKENADALKKGFDRALVKDKDDNDAVLSILGAMTRLDKKEAVGTLLVALNAPDYLVRKRAFEVLADTDLKKEFPGISASLEVARSKHTDQVLPYSPATGTKLGQVLNTDADYRRALSRKNGSVKAVLTTEKGVFTIVFTPEDAPLTVDNFIKLARAGYFNGLMVHRVVPNFVMQDGDPRGDGSGGPGWSIRCEVNMLPYDRGSVGMALSGKDTGGSQWFVTHSPQPHLDGGYTVFGHVNETDMKVVDEIVRGDKIISVKIIESLPRRTPSKMRRK